MIPEGQHGHKDRRSHDCLNSLQRLHARMTTGKANPDAHNILHAPHFLQHGKLRWSQIQVGHHWLPPDSVEFLKEPILKPRREIRNILFRRHSFNPQVDAVS